jgi:imidazole glycerol phosphate synthase, glutamine amidotransferase subunit
MADLVIVDYGAGNVKSVEFALNRLGVKPILSSDAYVVSNARRVIFPGVGHAEFAMDALKSKGLDAAIKDLNVPVLGICLGMQLMCTSTAEGDVEGLAIFDTVVNKFPAKDKIPHMGWNSIRTNGSPIFKGIPEESYFYFVHSYYAECCPNTSSVCDYILPFSASLEKDNFFGCQFHPEKSGEMGERLLSNFLKL